MSISAKITRKGQVTIPRRIREKLKSEVIEFAIVKGQVVIKPLPSVAGSLRAHGKKESIPFQEARENAWGEVAQERYGKTTGRR
jgi:bifunctional DNA-binding transcriptional regulator/antitoxin component of YhaV-PrlF toxin-antitoxin module